MLYVEYIKSSEITDDEWGILIKDKKTPRDFIDDTLTSMKTSSRFFGNELLLKLLYTYITSMDSKFITIDSLEKNKIIYRARIYTKSDAKEKYEDVS